MSGEDRSYSRDPFSEWRSPPSSLQKGSPVRQAVKRSPQDTCLIVTPDWPSRKRETNWGCCCTTAPGRRVPPPAPRGGACGQVWGDRGGCGRGLSAPFSYRDYPPFQTHQPAHLPQDEAPRACDASLLCTPSSHLDHLCVEHWQPQWGTEPTTPSINR